jgi:predicted RNA methylase
MLQKQQNQQKQRRRSLIFGDVVTYTVPNTTNTRSSADEATVPPPRAAPPRASPSTHMMVVRNLHSTVRVLVDGEIHVVPRAGLKRITNIPYEIAKRKYLFSQESDAIQSCLKLDAVSMYSVTDQISAVRIANILYSLPDIGFSTPIVDGTSCVGGNTHAFAQRFETVHAVELDEMRCEMLRSNMTVLRHSNVVITCGDILSIYQTLPIVFSESVVFIDPPWGGQTYRCHKKLHLYLNTHDIADICAKLDCIFKHVVLKVPYNFDFEHFYHINPKCFEYAITNRMRIIVTKKE